MDMFLSLVTLFLVANMAIVFTLLRRINLNSESVIAWEQTHADTPTVNAQLGFNSSLDTEMVQ
ncbi:hypothetical protein ACO1PK_08425 [Alishewanella sp. d11]|uniref:hypothetical protein n=1 Tax=Alishewanella sp. d11 TaxID=3414030 RepID=UPI003BF772D0